MSDRFVSRSPFDPGDVLGEFARCDAAAVDAATDRSRAAFSRWRETTIEARVRILRAFAARVREREDELARLIAREVGKALWDARAEASLVPAKIELTITDGLRLIAPIEAAAGARATFHPRGVLAVIGPFNFPAHLPNGHIAPALVTGNAVIWKPSELAPAVAEWIAVRWAEAGLPDDVLVVVQGGAETGRLLAGHRDIDGVLFTGSWTAGRSITAANLDQPDKILALELGGKNAVVVLRDADLELAVAETAVSICASTGQRCSCASRIFVAREIAEPFTDRLVRVLRGVRAGHPFDPGVFMGPLVSCSAHEKLSRFRARAREAGGETLLGGEIELPAPYTAPGLVRFSNTAQTHPAQRDEWFGPAAALYAVDDLAQAIDAVNDADFGLVASVFTRDAAAFDHARGRVRTGLLNWNRGTIGASGRLPFGGRGRSGNDRPAGLFSTLYCTFVQSHLEHSGGFDPATLPPGMPRP